MGLSAQVIERLQGLTVDGEAILAGRTKGALDMAALQKANGWPQVTPAAHVVPMGIDGGKFVAMGAQFDQTIARAVAVYLTVRTHDTTGARWLDRIDDIIDAIILRLAGWTPESRTRGVMALTGVTLVQSDTGSFVYEIAFALDDELRITT